MADRLICIEDAIVFLDKVKCAYIHKPEVYGKLLTLVKDYKLRIINVDELVARVSSLFSERPFLIAEFSHFLPPDLVDSAKQTDTTERPSPHENSLQQAHAMHYVIKVRNRFIHRPLVYSQFLNILDVFNTDRGSVAHVLESVAQLFAREIDLLMEFAYFLPEALQEQAKARMDQAVEKLKAEESLNSVQPATATSAPTIASTGTQVQSPPLTANATDMPCTAGYAPQVPSIPHLPLPSPSHQQSAAPHVVPSASLSSSNNSSDLSTASSSSKSPGFEEISADAAHSSTPAEARTQGENQRLVTRRTFPTTEATNSNRRGYKRKVSAQPVSPHNTRKSGALKTAAGAGAAASSPIVLDDLPRSPQSTASCSQIGTNVQQALTHIAKMKSTLSGMDIRLSTLECLVDLQRKRLDEQRGEIAALKCFLSENLNVKK